MAKTIEEKRAQSAEYWRKNKGTQIPKHVEYEKNRYANDEEFRRKRAETMKRYYQKHKEQIQAQQKAYRDSLAA